MDSLNLLPLNRSPLNIGPAAELSGVSAKMIRHYESIGLVPNAHRTAAGYRQYSPDHIQVLKFIRHCRSLGFSIMEITALLGLWRDKNRPSRKVRELALVHIADLDRKIRELTEMKSSLTKLVASCHGDDRADCPILDELARDVAATAVKAPASRAKRKSAKHACH